MEELKHHHIMYKTGPTEGGAAQWEEEIGKVKGVRKVTIDAENRDVFVEYDLVNCCEEAIEHWMVSKGFVLDDSLMERLKRGWAHYTEENERDAILSKGGHSCCDAEEIERKKKELE
ncbi:MAG: hypothetical protein ACE5EI_10225 [Thermodesulfobacteriota bacterium]